MTDDWPAFEIGDHVRTKVAYHGDQRRTQANRVERRGTVVGKSTLYDNCYMVLWDGRSRPEALHARYLARDYG